MPATPLLRPIARLLLLTQLVSLLLAVVSGAMLFATARKFNAASEWVEHTHEVLDEIHAVRSALLLGALAVRNHVLASDGSQVDGMRRAARAASEATDRLEALVQDNPVQAGRAFALRGEVAEIVGWMQASAVIAERDGVEALRARAQSGITRDAGAGLQQQLTDMETQERLLLQARSAERAHEHRLLATGGAVAAVALAAFLIGSLVHSAALFRRGKSGIEGLRHSADRDPLTGLLNRRALDERFSRLGAAPLTVVAFDLDDFKPVNDAHGHVAGDAVLQATAHRLQAECRDEDLIARTGGDEFVVVLTGVVDADTARRVCARLQQALGEPIDVGRAWVRVSASLGHDVSAGGVPLKDLMARADAAAYADKCRRKAVGAVPASPGR